MKLLYCERCYSIVVPNPTANEPTFCRCEAHPILKSACWWEDPAVGLFKIYCPVGVRFVSALGIHNGFLAEPIPEDGLIRGSLMQELIEETPESYFFKQFRSLIVRFRPGASSDTSFTDKWEDVPQPKSPG